MPPGPKAAMPAAAKAAGGAESSAPSFFFWGGDAGGEPENLQAAIVEACLQNGLWRSLIVECDFGMAVRNCALPGSTDMFMLRWKDMEVRMAMCYNHAVNERSKKTNRYFSI
jgi:hypothetical protein